MLGASLTQDELDDMVSYGHLESGDFSNTYFQDGNGKVDYDEFVKMLMQY